jgi:hypothetical protein
MVLHALLYFGSFAIIVVLFASVISAIWWLFKKGLRALGKFVRAITEE